MALDLKSATEGDPARRRLRRVGEMGLRYHTIIVVPHTRARFRKWRVTHRQLTLAATVFAVLLLGSVATTWSFFSNTIDRQELARIRAENERIREVNATFEGSLRELEDQLAQYEERTRQLAIVAGLGDLAGDSEEGVGGLELSLDDDVLGGFEGRFSVLDRRLSSVEQGLSEQLLRISSTPAIAPAKGVLTSGFGVRADPITGGRASHPGVDIASYPGAPVVAPADGVVMKAGRNGGLGKAVSLSHGFGITTRFGHLSRIAVEPGTQVHRGDVLGYVGSTGRATGYHLHYEVRVDGNPVNPLGYILEPLPRRF